MMIYEESMSKKDKVRQILKWYRRGLYTRQECVNMMHEIFGVSCVNADNVVNIMTSNYTKKG